MYETAADDAERDRIKGALERGMRGFGRDLRRTLRSLSVQVRVEPDLRRFDAQLLAGVQRPAARAPAPHAQCPGLTETVRERP